MSESVTSEIFPINTGEIASPNKWINKMFIAIAVALILGWTTLMIAAFSGPVLKNKKKTVRKTKGKAQALLSIKIDAAAIGVAKNIPMADIRK